MRTSPAVLLTVLGSAWGLGCGSNGASGPVVTVAPHTLTVSTGDTASGFLATLSNGAVDPVTWTLTGPGSISSTTGDNISYLPPALGESGGTATLRATAGCGAGCVPVGDTATITVNAATTGTLTIIVSLQGASQATLAVTGPGYSQSVTTPYTTTLTGLAPGSYTVTGAPIIVPNNIVTAEYTAPVEQVSVVANAAAMVNVTYASVPGYGMMWVPGMGDVLDGFASGDLTVNKTPSITPTTTGPVQGIAFDAAGNMWASFGAPVGAGSGSVVHYPAAGLANSAALTPDVTLSDAHISNPAAVALGPDGRLWVANCAPDSVAAYPLLGGPADLTVTSTSGVFHCPRGLAFDSTGNLWVANSNGVTERLPNNGQLSGTTMPTVDTTLAAPPSPASSEPYGIALDENGNVWVAFCGGSTVASYADADFPGTNIAPAAVLTPVAMANPRTLDCPVALALDNSGLLWVANAGTDAGPTLSQFALSDMASGGAAQTQISVTGIGVTVGGMAFNPSPTGLPLRH